MRLLVVTQVVDLENPVLGFFHRWLGEFATRFDGIQVICLSEGKHELPENVRVYSLGKERGIVSRMRYVWRLYQLLWQLRGSYDAVFVHMNQEYVLLAGWWWWLARTPVHLWRNHYAGSWLTDAAAAFCTKIFCTSQSSYTARFRKTTLMPAGVDTGFFRDIGEPVSRSILSLGRIAPSKRLEILIDALVALHAQNVGFSCSIYGDALLHDKPYLRSLQELVASRGLGEAVHFHSGVPNDVTPSIYNAHEIFVNLSSSGMYDKTILEAASCGCYVLAASEDLARDAGQEFAFTDAKTLAEKLRYVFSHEEERHAGLGKLRTVAAAHSLDALTSRLAAAIRHSQ